jgi:hypothetical protein
MIQTLPLVDPQRVVRIKKVSNNVKATFCCALRHSVYRKQNAKNNFKTNDLTVNTLSSNTPASESSISAASTLVAANSDTNTAANTLPGSASSLTTTSNANAAGADELPASTSRRVTDASSEANEDGVNENVGSPGAGSLTGSPSSSSSSTNDTSTGPTIPGKADPNTQQPTNGNVIGNGNTSTGNENQGSSTPSSSLNAPLVVGLSVAGVMVLVVGFFVYSRNQQQQNQGDSDAKKGGFIDLEKSNTSGGNSGAGFFGRGKVGPKDLSAKTTVSTATTSGQVGMMNSGYYARSRMGNVPSLAIPRPVATVELGTMSSYVKNGRNKERGDIYGAGE